jgi:hypothetical protein
VAGNVRFSGEVRRMGRAARAFLLAIFVSLLPAHAASADEQPFAPVPCYQLCAHLVGIPLSGMDACEAPGPPGSFAQRYVPNVVGGLTFEVITVGTWDIVTCRFEADENGVTRWRAEGMTWTDSCGDLEGIPLPECSTWVYVQLRGVPIKLVFYNYLGWPFADIYGWNVSEDE